MTQLNKSQKKKPENKAVQQTEQPSCDWNLCFQSIISSIPCIFYRCKNDPDWTMLFLSDTIEEVLGYPASEFMEKGYRSLGELIHPEDREWVWETVQEFRKDNEPFDIEYRVIDSEGRTHWLYEHGRCIKESDEKVVYLEGVIFDTTECHAVEQDLDKTRRLLQAAIESSPAGIIIADAPDGKIQTINGAGLKIRGKTTVPLNDIPIELHPENWQCYHLDGTLYKPEELPLSRAILKGETVQNEEVYIRHADGTGRWIIANAAPVRDADGHVTAGVVVFPDITDRKQIEEALKASESRYRNLFNYAGDSIFLMHERRFIDCNLKTQEVFGCTRDQIVGKTPVDFSPEFQPDGELSDTKGLSYIRRALEGEPQRFEWVHTRFDGTSFDAEVSLSRLDLPDQMLMLALVRDVSIRKQAERALREKEKFISGMIQASPGITFVTDEQGPIYISGNIEGILGFTAEEIQGMHPGGFYEHMVHPDDQDRLNSERAANFSEWNKTGIDHVRSIEVRLRTKDDKWRWVLVSRTVFKRNKDGLVLQLIGIGLDITQQKKAEDELRDALSEVKKLKAQLEAENVYLRQEIRSSIMHGDIVAHSEAMKQILVQAEQVAPTNANVLILGETGTGKELLSRAIHNLSDRKYKPLVVVNCAAIPSTLVESELFGREKGAFTGALTRQIGRFEVADGSTIFLDEIGELPAEVQAKLLRVLQENQFERLGSTKTISVDVRIIAATNRDLEEEVAQGRFRQDLFYRLNVFPITIPPLRERRDDITAMAWEFVSEFSKKMGKHVESISRKSLEELQRYPWPGNVRELRNVIERSMIQEMGRTLRVSLPNQRSNTRAEVTTLSAVERDHIVKILEGCGWRIRGKEGAAETLGLKPSTLESRMKKLGIKRPVNQD